MSGSRSLSSWSRSSTRARSLASRIAIEIEPPAAPIGADQSSTCSSVPSRREAVARRGPQAPSPPLPLGVEDLAGAAGLEGDDAEQLHDLQAAEGGRIDSEDLSREPVGRQNRAAGAGDQHPDGGCLEHSADEIGRVDAGQLLGDRSLALSLHRRAIVTVGSYPCPVASEAGKTASDAPDDPVVAGTVEAAGALGAWRLAAEAHAGQRRAADQRPYIHHPERVAALVAGEGGDDAMIEAALLHDVIEDSDLGSTGSSATSAPTSRGSLPLSPTIRRSTTTRPASRRSATRSARRGRGRR